MRVVVIDGPEDIDVTWYTDDTGEILYVALSPALDDVTRQRYIAEAKREHGIEDQRRRRRLFIPLLPARYGDATSAPAAATAVAVGGGVLAVGVAAAIVVPAVLEGNGQPPAHRPRVAAPARPSSPPKEENPRREPSPSEAPTRPGRTAEPSPPEHPLPHVAGLRLPSVPRHLIGRTPPVGETGSAVPPHVPKPPALPSPPPARMRPLLRVDLPPIARASVRLSPQPQIKVRLGSRKP